MKRLVPLVGTLLILFAIAAPIAVALREQRITRNFAVVQPGVLYRSAQLPTRGLQRLYHDYGIRTVVCIRDESAVVEAERAWCEANEIEFIRMPACNWNGPPGSAPIDTNLRNFLSVVRDPAKQPVLVHCFAGIHRTGGYVAIYRMAVEGWSNRDAIKEMRVMGYTDIDNDRDIRDYLDAFRPSVLGSQTVQR